ncbi:MAG: DUF2069 domain-containing protein [Hahellaceae bacterium]|nr:DUF2069 domain-containing protein [Hahellaceae bacterium]
MNLLLKIRISHAVTYVCYVLLLGLLLATTPFDANLTALALMLSVKFIPLLIVLPGMLMNSLKSYIWLCFIVLFYFTESTVQAWLSQGEVIPTTMAIASVVMFISAMYYVRWQRQNGLGF